MVNNFSLEEIDYTHVRDTFSHELSLAATGEKTTLPFLRNPLHFNKNLLKNGEFFQVFVIGGTNGTVATLQKSSDTVKIISQQEVSLINLFSTTDEFFIYIEKYLDKRVSVIGINFAFGLTPIDNNGILDGLIIGGDAKGHKFIDSKNIPIGQQITNYFKSKGKSLTVSVVNDAICLLLSSLQENLDPLTTGAYIVGTGCNLAFYLTEAIAVNTQASDFSNYLTTTTEKVIDEQSSNPGKQIFAKEVAAGELYKHFNILSKQYNLKTNQLQSTEDLNELASSNNGEVSLLAQKLMQRSACFVASQIAGFYEFKQKPMQMHMIIEGSLFLKGFQYKTYVAEQLEKFGISQNKIIFHEIPNSNILGISKLLLG